MLQTQLELLEHICQEELGQSLRDRPMGNLNGLQVVDILRPASDIFDPVINRIANFPYQFGYENKADKAICDFVLHNRNWVDDGLVPEVWRTLLERHIQTINFCLEKAQLDSLMLFPGGMTERAQLKFAIVFWWYSMKLPYECDDKSTHDTLARFHKVTVLRD